jgi:hypothetical protein
VRSRPRERADGDVVAVLLARLGLGQADAGDLRVGVDRARHRAVVDDRVVAAGVLGRDLTLAEGGVRELPVTGAVADGVDVLHVRAAVLVGADALRLSNSMPAASSPRFSTSGPRPTATSIRSHWTLSVTEVDGQRVALLLDLGALLAELQVDAALRELLGELLRGVASSWDQRVEHLDHRHLGAEATEDRRKLGADDAAAEDDEPLRISVARAGRSSRRRGRFEAGIGGRSGNEPVATTAVLNVTSSPPSTEIVFASLNGRSP